MTVVISKALYQEIRRRADEKRPEIERQLTEMYMLHSAKSGRPLTKQQAQKLAKNFGK